MYEFRMQFAGEIPAVHGDRSDHGAALERIGREIVDLLRQQGYLVGAALINGPCAIDVTAGVPKMPSMQVDEVTKNERKKTTNPPSNKPGV